MVGGGGAKQRSILRSGARTRRSGALESARAPPPRARLRFALRAPEPGAARWANGEARRGVPRRRGGAACGGGPRLGRGVRKKKEIFVSVSSSSLIVSVSSPLLTVHVSSAHFLFFFFVLFVAFVKIVSLSNRLLLASTRNPLLPRDSKSDAQSRPEIHFFRATQNPRHNLDPKSTKRRATQNPRHNLDLKSTSSARLILRRRINVLWAPPGCTPEG